ncbi:hypothetical protein [Brevundimonas sp.]|uniref:hypothetical protein n=1 Tax=Brevundimonas sp. TaxID=1871086 RepID=UPI002FC6A33E
MMIFDFNINPLIRSVQTREKIEMAQAWLDQQGIAHDFTTMIVVEPDITEIALFRFENLDDLSDFQIEVIDDQ